VKSENSVLGFLANNVISRIVVISQCSFIQRLLQSKVELIIQNSKKRKGI